MALRNTESQEIETTGVAESLPDPALVNGRLHELTNTGTAACVWSSVGATPFLEGGVPVATITVARGESKQLQSDGTRWVAKSRTGGRPIYAATGVSDAAGNVIFTWPAGTFSAAPVVDVAVQAAAGSNPIDFRITALTAVSCTVNVRQSPTLVVLSLSVLGVAVALAGVTVHCIATSAGTSP